MDYVADTHSLVWYFTDDSHLGEKALKAFELTAQEGIIIIPSIVLAEIIFIPKKGRITLTFEETLKRIEEAITEDFYDYDLICFGSPVHHSLPSPQVLEFIERNDKRYRHTGEVVLASPKLINKNALVFCTYSGPHCGLNEALPAGKYIRQFLEHLGFDVKDEWYEVGEFHGWNEASVQGKLGDITGQPHEDDLVLVELKAARLARSL